MSDPIAPKRAELHLPWRELLTLFVCSRLLIWLVAGLSLLAVEKGPHFVPVSNPLDWFVRWDAGWFLGIARDGYFFTVDGASTNVVFLPLYPALLRLASLGGLVPLTVAGYVVSFACLWLACVWMWRLVAHEWNDPKLATTAVTLLLFGPVGFFFSSLYSEAAFLPLAIGCVWFARKDRWWLAGALGAFAACTRFVGLVLIVPLAWEYITTNRRAGGMLPRLRLAPLVAIALPLAGFGAYCLLMWVQFGDPLMYFRGHLHWGREFAWWWDLFARESFSAQPAFYQIWFAGTVVLSLGLLALGALMRVPSTYLLFALALACIYVSSRFPEALPRYFSVVFPLYFILAIALRRWPAAAIPVLATSAALQAFSVVLFVNGYWFT